MLFSYLVYSVYGWKQIGQEGSCSAEKTAGETRIPGDSGASGDTLESWCLTMMVERGILRFYHWIGSHSVSPPVCNWKPLAIWASVICIVSVLAPSDMGLPIFLYRYLLIFPAMCINWEIWNSCFCFDSKVIPEKRDLSSLGCVGQKNSDDNHFWRHT